MIMIDHLILAITDENHSGNQSELEEKENRCNRRQVGKTHASNSRLVLVLLLIDWQSGANLFVFLFSFLKSQSVALQNQSKRKWLSTLNRSFPVNNHEWLPIQWGAGCFDNQALKCTDPLFLFLGWVLRDFKAACNQVSEQLASIGKYYTRPYGTIHLLHRASTVRSRPVRNSP